MLFVRKLVKIIFCTGLLLDVTAEAVEAFVMVKEGALSGKYYYKVVLIVIVIYIKNKNRTASNSSVIPQSLQLNALR